MRRDVEYTRSAGDAVNGIMYDEPMCGIASKRGSEECLRTKQMEMQSDGKRPLEDSVA